MFTIVTPEGHLVTVPVTVEAEGASAIDAYIAKAIVAAKETKGDTTLAADHIARTVQLGAIAVPVAPVETVPAVTTDEPKVTRSLRKTTPTEE